MTSIRCCPHCSAPLCARCGRSLLPAGRTKFGNRYCAACWLASLKRQREHDAERARREAS